MSILVINWHKMLISYFNNRDTLFVIWKQYFLNVTSWNVSLSILSDWSNSAGWKIWTFECFPAGALFSRMQVIPFLKMGLTDNFPGIKLTLSMSNFNFCWIFHWIKFISED
jgi:hypothetical protein